MSDMTNYAQNTGWRGLTEDEVNERVEQGLVNQSDISTGKSVKNIILSNILTYFSNYSHTADLRWFLSQPDIFTCYYRKHGNWNCTGASGQANTG